MITAGNGIELPHKILGEQPTRPDGHTDRRMEACQQTFTLSSLCVCVPAAGFGFNDGLIGLGGFVSAFISCFQTYPAA